MPCHAEVNIEEIIGRTGYIPGILDEIEDDTFFWERLNIGENLPHEMGPLYVMLDIKRNRQDKKLVYILIFSNSNCKIGSYNYTETDYFYTLKEIDDTLKAYNESTEKCNERIIQYMDNYHQKLMEIL
jgi:hypothetical protein